MKSYSVIIRGPLGVGKSSVSKLLAEHIDASYISIDKLLAKYHLDKAASGGGIPVANFLKVNRLAIEQAGPILAKSGRVIFDGNFYYEEQVKDLLSLLSGDETYLFTLQASLATCITRDKNRSPSYGVDAATAVYQLVGNTKSGILIDTEGKTLAAVVDEIRRYLAD